MSFYPNPTSSNSSIYNPSDYIGSSDVSNGQVLTLNLNLENYVRVDASYFQSNLNVADGYNLVLNGNEQNQAFTDELNDLLAVNTTKLTDIAYSNNQTTIQNNLAITGSLLISDNGLTISKISGLQNKINEFETNFNNISNQDEDILDLQNFKTSQLTINTNNTNLNNTQNSRLDNIETYQTTNTANINSINNLNISQNSRLDLLDNFKLSQEIYNSINDSSINSLNSLATSYDTRLDNLESYQISNNTTILNLQNTDDILDGKIDNILIDITALESADNLLQENINSNDNAIITINGTLASLNTSLSSQASSIANLQSLSVFQGSSISTLNSSVTANTLAINNLQNSTSNIGTIQSDVTTLKSDMLTKQAIINSSNRLNASFIGDGSVSSLAYQTLAGINTSSSIESRLTNLQNSINSLNIDTDTLENLQNIDLTTFSTIGGQITALQTYDTANTQNISNMSSNILNIQTDVGNLQTNTASNTGNIINLQSTVSNHTSNITNILNDVSLLQSSVSTNTADLLTKNDIIDINNKLNSSLVSTNVNSTPSTLNLILQSLTDVNTTQSTSITNMNSTILNLENSIDSIDTQILALQNADSTHDTLISSLTSNLQTTNNNVALKQNIINVNNKLNSSLVFDTSGNDTLNNIIVRIDNDIGTKQNIIDTNNKLSYSNINFTGSNFSNLDYGSSISSKFTSLDGQISTLTGLQNGDIANFQAISDNFDTVESSITSINNQIVKVPYLANVTADVQQQIDNLISSNLPSLSYNSGTTTTTVTNNLKATNIIFSGDLSEQTTAFTNLKNTALTTATSDISSLNTLTTSQGSAISTLQNDMTGKQSLLNNTDNKLMHDKIDFSTSNIRFADFPSSINTKFTNVDSTLSTQSSLNTSLTNDITSLNTNKQNILSGSNKLNPAFIDASSGSLTNTKMNYLSTIDADIITKFDAKANIDNQTFTGTTGIVELNMTGFLSSNGISEKIASAFTSFSSNILTYNFTGGTVLYFTGLTANTNFKVALTNVPTVAYRTQTFSLLINVATYKAYANTFSVNGVNSTLYANGGLSNVSVANVSTSGMLLQQFTIIYLNSGVWKVITNVSEFY